LTATAVLVLFLVPLWFVPWEWLRWAIAAPFFAAYMYVMYKVAPPSRTWKQRFNDRRQR
jgi:hypothetical protein